MKQRLALCLTLALLVSLFSGCTKPLPIADDPAVSRPTLETPETAAPLPTQTGESAPTPDSLPRRLVNGGVRDYAPDGYIDMVKFPDMPYERPDTDALCRSFETLAEMAERGDDAADILSHYYAASDAYLNFYHMDSLAYIRYTLNTNDSYYKEEYDALELLTPDVEEKLEAFNKACAHSPSRQALERDYFGYGYFDRYEDFSLYTNPDYLALSKQEEALMAEYRSALEDPQIRFEGKTESYYDLMDSFGEIETYSEYLRYLKVMQAYYDQYNPIVGGIYLELVKVRRQIAETLGYESYADYAYEVSFERDYSYDQGRQFLQDIRTELVPIAAQLDALSLSPDFTISGEQLTQGLESVARQLGGPVEQAYDFMIGYALCDLRAAPEKFDSSYTTYLPAYEAPFLTVNAQGNARDYTTFSHEFGHFVDYFANYGGDEDLETAETFSQAMEFLSLTYTQGIFTEQQRQTLIDNQLSEMIDTFTYQAALAEFEDQVYRLSERELTLDRINEIYCQCCKDYGIYAGHIDFYYHQGWIDVTHFFEVPFYVISYCVSADTALQVYMLEAQEPGAGVAAYFRLLDREIGAGVQSVMRAGGLENPFRKGALQELAAFYRERFDLN